jgi:hypothetical protein
MTKEILARDGIVVPLSAPVSGPLTLPLVLPVPFDQTLNTLTRRTSAAAVFFQVYHVHASLVASRDDHDEMLEFSARNGIKPLVQVFKLKGGETVSEVFGSIFQNKVRYRAVLEM